MSDMLEHYEPERKITRLEAEIDRLRAENEALRADAERYRALIAQAQKDMGFDALRNHFEPVQKE